MKFKNQGKFFRKFVRQFNPVKITFANSTKARTIYFNISVGINAAEIVKVVD